MRRGPGITYEVIDTDKSSLGVTIDSDLALDIQEANPGSTIDISENS